MRKVVVFLLVAVAFLFQLSAATHKTGDSKTYIGITAGYSGIHESIFSAVGKALAAAFGAAFSFGHAVPDVDVMNENTIPIGVDAYFEINNCFSLSSTAGCAIAFTEDTVAPAPFVDVMFYGRLNGGENGDFLLGGGIGSMGIFKPDGLLGELSLLGGMRYQLDVAEHLGWYLDLVVGWNAFSYTDDSIIFNNGEGLSFMHTIRTGVSYSF